MDKKKIEIPDEAKKEIKEIKKESKKEIHDWQEKYDHAVLENTQLKAREEQLKDLLVEAHSDKERKRTATYISIISLLINLICWLSFFVLYPREQQWDTQKNLKIFGNQEKSSMKVPPKPTMKND